MTTPTPPGEPPRPRAVPPPGDLPRRLNALWMLALRRFREHLTTTDRHTTDEDTDGRTR